MNSPKSYPLGRCVLLILCFPHGMLAKEPAPDTKSVVLAAFRDVHDGWSTDEVLLQDKLNRAFLARCRVQLPDADATSLNWTLLNLRKAGKIDIEVTKRRRTRHSAYVHLAEIAVRTVQAKHNLNTDRIMCDPHLRSEFQKQCHFVAKHVDPYLMRKAAFTLRKTRRLQPELILRVADWDRAIEVHQAGDLVSDLRRIPELPGIYIFRDSSGYLYIGESKDLRERLTKHLDQSDRESLAHYLREHGIKDTTIEIHSFPKDSRARLVSIRRAYESELIASRKPRFNVRP